MSPHAECVKSTTATRIKIAEHGRQAIFVNPAGEKHKVIRADGCLYVNTLSADYIICGPPGDLVVELKGSDVNHALEQVSATISNWSRDERSARRIAAMIVCARIPKVDSRIQRAKLVIAKTYNTRLTVCSRNQDHSLSNFFPLR